MIIEFIDDKVITLLDIIPISHPLFVVLIIF